MSETTIKAVILGVFHSTRLGSHCRADFVIPGCQVVMCCGACVSGVEPGHIRWNALAETDWTQSSDRFSLVWTVGEKRMVSCALFHFDFLHFGTFVTNSTRYELTSDLQYYFWCLITHIFALLCVRPGPAKVNLWQLLLGGGLSVWTSR